MEPISPNWVMEGETVSDCYLVEEVSDHWMVEDVSNC
jgi:hypothetical protein